MGAGISRCNISNYSSYRLVTTGPLCAGLASRGITGGLLVQLIGGSCLVVSGGAAVIFECPDPRYGLGCQLSYLNYNTVVSLRALALLLMG